jgi:thioredoxin reductase (NADPH)
MRKLGIPGEAEYLGSGVSYCATCDGFFFKERTVIVVGGGDTAVEEALYLSRLAKKVYLVHRKKTLRASKILQNRLLNEPGIEVIWNTNITEIKGDGRTVTAVSYEDTVTGEKGMIPADGVFIFIGYVPNNQLIPPEVRTNTQGFVITDEKCETNVPGIFAVGDLRQKFANQIVIAAADGAIAALGAARYVEERKAARFPDLTQQALRKFPRERNVPKLGNHSFLYDDHWSCVCLRRHHSYLSVSDNYHKE